MTPVVIAVIVVLSVALVAVAYFLAQAVRHGASTVTKPVEDLTSLARPITTAVGDVGRAIAQRIQTKQETLAVLRRHVGELSAKVAQLECRRIAVNEAKAVLQLAVVDADLSYTDFDLTTTGSTEATLLQREEREEYLGVVRVDYRQRLGVDLEDLRFQRVGAHEIEVQGLGQTEVIGARDVQTTRLLIELRQHTAEGTVRGAKSVIVTGDPHDNRSRKEREQLDRILKVVNERPDSREIDRAIEGMALSFLGACFAPTGYRVVPARGHLSEPRSFFDICREINDELDALTAAERRMLQETSERAEALELEILDDSRQELRRLEQNIAERLDPARAPRTEPQER